MDPPQREKHLCDANGTKIPIKKKKDDTGE